MSVVESSPPTTLDFSSAAPSSSSLRGKMHRKAASMSDLKDLSKIQDTAIRVVAQAAQMQKKIEDACNESALSKEESARIVPDMKDLSTASKQLSCLTTSSNNSEIYDQTAILDGVRVQVQKEAEKKKIKLEFAKDPNIPIRFQGIPAYRIINVLVNFVSNAIRFSKNGSSIEIAMKFAPETGDRFRIRFSVRDTGEGMTKEQADKLFSPSRKSDEAVQVGDKDKGGTGIGIASCIEEVRKMN